MKGSLDSVDGDGSLGSVEGERSTDLVEGDESLDSFEGDDDNYTESVEGDGSIHSVEGDGSTGSINGDQGEMSMPLWSMLVQKDWNLFHSINPRSEFERGRKRLKDNLVGSGPALIAVTGLPRTAKTVGASLIARFLRCSHLDFDDIRTCMQEAHRYLLVSSTDPKVASSAHNHLDELSHQALLQFASTQLLLGHDVVVDSPLMISRPAAMGELLEVADSHRVPLIVIECYVLEDSVWQRRLMAENSKSKYSSSTFSGELDIGVLLKARDQSFDHDINNFPRLVIDTGREYFAQLELLDRIALEFILLYKQNLGSNCKGNASSSQESRQQGEKLKRHFSHSHPLSFIPEQDTNHMADCRICLLPITESSYNCPQCDFAAHQACIELPQFKKFPFHIHPLGLCVLSYRSTGSEVAINNCIICNGDNRGPVYRCWQCDGLIFFHQKCAELSPELKHEGHDDHPLKPDTYNYYNIESSCKYTCRACGHGGEKIWYGCSACELKLHLACALELPLEVDFKCGQWHPLALASPPKDNKYDEYFCDVCEEPRHRDYWIYYCRSCPFHAHLNCVNPEIPAYSMPSEEPNNFYNGQSEEWWNEAEEEYWSQLEANDREVKYYAGFNAEEEDDNGD